MIDPTSQFDQKIVKAALGCKHRLPERTLGHISQHQRQHQRRQGVVEFVEE